MIFVLVSTITPGPNNFLLATSGIKFGFRATWPHVFGIHCGIYLLVLLCGLGLGQILEELPEAMWALKLFGTGYLIYLAWKILGFDMSQVDIESSGRPMRFAEAALFQFSNPKAWMMVTTGLNIALGDEEASMLSAGVFLCLGFATIGLGCNLTWLSAGASLRQLWIQERYQKLINSGLAVLTLLAIATFWWK
jgi:threonine/homoserine/homoserine lactone efflux protein